MSYKMAIYLILSFGILLYILFLILKEYFYNSKKKSFSNDNKIFKDQNDKKSITKNFFIKREYNTTKEVNDSIENIRIVGITKPIGKWTKLVMSEKLQRMVGFNFDKTHKGFWQMFVKMESLSQGKHQGRSRGSGSKNSRKRK